MPSFVQKTQVINLHRKNWAVYVIASLSLLIALSCSISGYFQTDDEAETQAATQSVPAPTETEVAEIRQTPSDSPPPTSISPEIAAQMDEIQQQVAAMRGLTPPTKFERALLSPEQLKENVLTELLVDYTDEEAQRDGIVLAAFGLLESGFDIQQLLIDLLSEQVAGYYDDETKEMYVVASNRFGGPERITYAHEYEHAIQDYAYDIENGLDFNDEACDLDSERCAAVQALLEGDATMLEIQWFQEYSTPEDLTELLEFYNSLNTPVLDNAPGYIKEDLLFPYLKGQVFVQALYEQGGWASVDAAFRNLPVSTEQILHPERYPSDRPISVTLADMSVVLGSAWTEIDRGVNGEWYTYLLLAAGVHADARLTEDQASLAAEGWGGDAYAVYYNATSIETVLILQTIWETEQDAVEFFDGLSESLTGRFGVNPVEANGDRTWEAARQISELRRTGAVTTWVLAPDSATLAVIWDQLQQP